MLIQFIRGMRICAVLAALAGTGGAEAQEAADTRAQPYLLAENFYEICDSLPEDPYVEPVLPSEWVVVPPLSDGNSYVQCSARGIGAGGSNAFIYNTSLFKEGSRPLTRGRYMLSGAGSAVAIQVKNRFGDASFDRRMRVLALHAAAAPIVSALEFEWDDRDDRGGYGLLEIGGTGLQWLRLEKMPGAPIAPRTYAVPGANPHTWTLASGTTVQAEALGARLTGGSLLAARMEQTMALPPGRYEISTRTRGPADLVLSSGPAAGMHRFRLVEESPRTGIDDAAVAVTARFTATGQPVTVSLGAATAGQDLVVYPVEIRPVVEATPTREQLAARRPSPWPARGATTTNLFDLVPDTRPPRDLNGVECARQPAPWSSNPTWAHHADFADLKSLGGNLVRIGVPTLARALQSDCRLVAPADVQANGRISAEAFWSKAWPVIMDEVAAVVQVAGNAGLKVVLLMSPTTPTVDLNDRPDGWADLQAKKDFVRGYREMAAHLSPLRQHVWAYDLLNEPYEFVAGLGNLPPSQWRNLAIDTIAAIRAAEQGADPQLEPSWVVYAPVLQPTLYMAPLYAQLLPLPDERVLYTEHYYDDFNFTHQNICLDGYPVGTLPYAGDAQAVRAALQPLSEFSQSTGAPVYVGEFGAAVWAGWSQAAHGEWTPRTDAFGQPIHDNVNWLRDVFEGLEAYGFAWTHHAYRTYSSWSPELIPVHGPCGPFEYQLRGQPDTPTMKIFRDYLQRNH